MKTDSPETVLVTGASSGIGLELARCFAADQSNLILVARNTAAMEQLAAELRSKYSITVHVFTADLSQSELPRQIFEQAGRAGLTVDVLVNNAGFGLHGSFAGLPLDRQMALIQVNIASLVELTGLFLPGMIQRRRGGILNVGSVAGFLPGPDMAVYYATKAFVLSFTEALHEELRGGGVTATALCPGPTQTHFSLTARGYHTREMQAAKMSAAAVAHAGHRAYRQGRCVDIPGLKNRLTTQLVRMVPRSIIRRAVARYNQVKQGTPIKK